MRERRLFRWNDLNHERGHVVHKKYPWFGFERGVGGMQKAPPGVGGGVRNMFSKDIQVLHRLWINLNRTCLYQQSTNEPELSTDRT